MTSTAPGGFLHLQGLREVRSAFRANRVGLAGELIGCVTASRVQLFDDQLTDIDARVEEDRGQA